ncbi:MAG: hypothetical protein AAF236_15970, partial [Verrucomicrobiota bacterium]
MLRLFFTLFCLTTTLGLAQELPEEAAPDGNESPGEPPAPGVPGPIENPWIDVVARGPRPESPTVRALAAVDEANVIFLTKRGEIALASFSPELDLLGWSLYTEAKLNTVASVAAGKNYSVLTASPYELTQSFDSDGDGRLDFFQSLVRDWIGRDEGVTITAGPVVDFDGTVFFALSNPAISADAPTRVVAFLPDPDAEDVTTVIETSDTILSLAVTGQNEVGALLKSRDHYLLATLPASPINIESDAEAIGNVTWAERIKLSKAMLGETPPSQLVSLQHAGEPGWLVINPAENRVIEIRQSTVGEASTEGDAPRVRSAVASWIRIGGKPAVDAVVQMDSGRLLAGNSEGFFALPGNDPEIFSITGLTATEQGLRLTFSKPVDRPAAVEQGVFELQLSNQ